MFFNIKINLKTLKKAGCDAKTNIQLLINNKKKNDLPTCFAWKQLWCCFPS